ncbi:MAG: GNAT family N-acetyltransferase [Planctomycetes bacterium]|nr:GNAT family N-acetyltransferase [Planctomycetota bacterium]
MKPLLVIPPSPTRWDSVSALLENADAALMADLHGRVCDRLEGANDAFAVIPNGSLTLAFACIRRSEDVGVFGDLLTRADHRQRGFARSLLQTLLSWFDMTGGKWLYLTTPPQLASAIFENFGFRRLHQWPAENPTHVAMMRALSHVSPTPHPTQVGEPVIRPVTRADYPLAVSLLQHSAGPDSRVALAETAASAETFVANLLAQQERGVCKLLAATSGPVLSGIASVAVDQLGKRTYAMTMPHDSAPESLASAAVELGRANGYENVDFPLRALTAPSS